MKRKQNNEPKITHVWSRGPLDSWESFPEWAVSVETTEGTLLPKESYICQSREEAYALGNELAEMYGVDHICD